LHTSLLKPTFLCYLREDTWKVYNTVIIPRMEGICHLWLPAGRRPLYLYEAEQNHIYSRYRQTAFPSKSISQVLTRLEFFKEARTRRTPIWADSEVSGLKEALSGLEIAGTY